MPKSKSCDEDSDTVFMLMLARKKKGPPNLNAVYFFKAHAPHSHCKQETHVNKIPMKINVHIWCPTSKTFVLKEDREAKRASCMPMQKYEFAHPSLNVHNTQTHTHRHAHTQSMHIARIHTYIHTYTHRYIHAHMRTHTQTHHTNTHRPASKSKSSKATKTSFFAPQSHATASTSPQEA